MMAMPRNELNDTMTTQPERRKALRTAVIVCVLFGMGLLTQQYLLKPSEPLETEAQARARFERERDSLLRTIQNRPPDSLDTRPGWQHTRPPLPLE
jgi:hypothetical protein